MKPDCYEYIRRYYNVPAYIGVRVTAHGQKGVLLPMSSDAHYLHVLIDGEKFGVRAHPTDNVTYHVACPHSYEQGLSTCDLCGWRPKA